MSYQERALAIIDRLTDSKAINIRERGTLRRAILLPERPQGEWIKKQVTPASCTYVCSECGIEEVILGNFCCWCGADMRKGGADEYYKQGGYT